ncbi:unnamed protein product [Tilletia laevis]|uniref:Asl1-like glycosyl hydrolase catalytic domain-containing protein n=3 Tax=Tilletia TaxID=13289 RepID=A0A8X7MSQ1_9BASI|nr:hypothetical protein CF336_g4338 [Tilletia laevis]KAE8196826.1 hypothetical protein CF328_g4023 [Tilletia controversa]KAE8260971.1 hypothetical protein A4X03_0g3654 [Tilletia caries]KAE8202218.1 hypothetical protein CF335_g3503 [Tilletia laevis]KAE8247776.1 hypothetical protein A4X06_0g4203 [Tilletia controversa]
MQISTAFSRLSVTLLIALATVFLASTQQAQAVQPGLPWGASPQLARKLVKSGSNFQWYMNWGNNRPVSTLGSLNYVPTFWGQSKIDAWHSLEGWYKAHGKRPKYILAQNEPDVPSQSNTSPKAAAKQWMKELKPWQRRGVKVGSPQLCWDTTNWLEPFLRNLRNMGGKPDFCAAHYYGSATDLGRFKQYVRRVRSTCRKYGVKSIWLTEIGVMASSHPAQGEVNHFAQEVFQWLQTQPYVKRAAWIGVFEFDTPYDGFMSQKNAYFNSDGTLRSLGRIMAFGNLFGRRSLVRASAHAAIAERQAEVNGTLIDAKAALDDPRGNWDHAFAGDDQHDPNDDAYWDAKVAHEDEAGPADHDDDVRLHELADDVDHYQDGFLGDLLKDVVKVVEGIVPAQAQA